MPENDFLPFATGAGANVADQATYAGSATQTGGVTTGKASSSLFNKSMRQASMFAAAMAALIVEQLDTDVIDDGNLPALISLLTDAFTTLVSAVIPPPSQVYVAGARAANTVYTNTSSRPKHIAVTAAMGGSGTFSVSVGIAAGDAPSQSNTSSVVGSGASSLCVTNIVLPGCQYVMNNTSGAISGLANWIETTL
jgi:hypothetical protein